MNVNLIHVVDNFLEKTAINNGNPEYARKVYEYLECIDELLD